MKTWSSCIKDQHLTTISLLFLSVLLLHMSATSAAFLPQRNVRNVHYDADSGAASGILSNQPFVDDPANPQAELPNQYKR
jgi:hypothetical protein